MTAFDVGFGSENLLLLHMDAKNTQTKNTIHVESYRKVNGHNFLTQKMASLKDSVRPSIVHEIGMI